MATESDLFLGIFEDYLKDVGRMKDKSRTFKLVAEFELLFWRRNLTEGKSFLCPISISLGDRRSFKTC